MTALTGVIVILLAALALGKRARRSGGILYLVAVLLAVLQVCIVLYEMFTMPLPLE